MRNKKAAALGCTALLITAMMTGCAAKGNNSATTSQTETTTTQTTQAAQESSQSTENSNTTKNEQESDAQYGSVTAVDGNKVTVDVGTLNTSAPGDMPGGEAPSGDNSNGEAPSGDNSNGGAPNGDKPDGQASNGEAPSGDNSNGGAPSGDKPDGEAPNGEAPSGDNSNGGAPSGDKPEGDAPSDMPGGNGSGFGGSTFTASGESLSFTVTDDTEITVEFLQGSSEGTVDDIAVGSVLEFELDADGNATKITVKNLNAGGGFGGSSEVTNGTAANTIDEDTTVSTATYTSDGDDENALRIDGATVTLDGIDVEKTGGASSNTENGDFYGQNAALLALNGAQVTIKNAVISTDAVNGNAVFSYGEGTTVNISDSVIRTEQNNSGGIQTTGGGTTNASNLDVVTNGNSAAAIRSDRGGGTVNVDGGTYVTNGTGSPAVYCTADITVANATLTANSSEGVVVEGKNSVSLINSDVTGNMSNTYNGDSDENIHCIMIYQSMSGDADLGEASFSAEGGSITAKTGDMFYITNTDCTISLKNVAFTLANDTFLRVEGNSSSRGWGTQGANGGDVVLNAEEQKLEGNILVDSISSLELSMTSNSTFTGAINPDGEGGTVDVTLDETSTWTLTADSYVTSFTGDLTNVTANGYHLYVNGEMAL